MNSSAMRPSEGRGTGERERAEWLTVFRGRSIFPGMRSSVHVILNPTSGGGAGRRIRQEIERELAARGLRFTLEETTHRGHAVELARAAVERGAETIVAAGGDGTVHEVANGLLTAVGEGGRPALGVIPVGTGNDFVKALGGVMSRARAYDVLADGEVRHFDVGRVEWEGGCEFFVNGMGTGIDVEVVRQIERLPRLPGVVSYLLGLLRALARFRAIPLRITWDGERRHQKVHMIAIGNGACIGGGFYVCPNAVPHDGRFDLCIVDELSLLQIARLLPRVMRGTHEGQPMVQMRQAVEIEIEAAGDAPLFFQMDGELREPPGGRRLRVRVEHGALPVVAPRTLAGGR